MHEERQEVYGDTDFFLALIKSSDWLKENAKKIYKNYKKSLTTSEITFLELMLLAKRYKLPLIKTTAAAMKIGNYNDTKPIAAAKLIEEGFNVFDAFHAIHCNGKIISSDKIFDEINIERIRLEGEKK